jgi:hypothetical protein
MYALIKAMVFSLHQLLLLALLLYSLLGFLDRTFPHFLQAATNSVL